MSATLGRIEPSITAMPAIAPGPIDIDPLAAGARTPGHRPQRRSRYAEVSSSITIAAARRLARDGTIAPDASVVCLLTATGLKDPATTLRSLPAATERTR